MLKNPYGLCLLVSLCIAVATTFLLCVATQTATTGFILTCFAVTLIASGTILHFAVRRFIARPISALRNYIEAATFEKDNTGSEKYEPFGPFKTVAEAFDSFAEDKRREVEDLRKVEAFRKDFIADVSHELKTPIFAAQGFIHTLLDGAMKEKAVRKKFLKKAAKSLDGLDMLVQELLILSHIETGQIKMRFEDVDLYALTEEVFDQFKGKHNKKSVTLRIDGRVRKVLVWADRQRIFQVLTNLISNAIKHSHEGGEVEVSFSVRPKSVITRVRDSGEGIPPEHINRIFERFYRVDKSRSREKGGTGLGLAIVKHILEGHQTKAQVESTPGKGSVFSFKLPRATSEENGDRQHPQAVAEEGTKDQFSGFDPV